jgi:1-acyl-sn-glycerol-3-phosphate acyltransferase
MTAKIKPFRSLGLWGTTLVLTPTIATVAGASALAGDRRGKVWWTASRAWAAGILKAAGVTDFIVKGVEVLYDGSPYIVMSNHESHLDPPSIIRSSERPVGFLTKQELKAVPVFGWALERTGHVFIDRKHREKSHASIDKAASKIAEGRCVAVFPEGSRTVDGELLPFKKGGFILATRAHVPIVPVAVAGTREIFPAQNRYVRACGPVAVVYGTPIPTSDYTLETKDALMSIVREHIESLRTEARALVAEAYARGR